MLRPRIWRRRWLWRQSQLWGRKGPRWRWLLMMWLIIELIADLKVAGMEGMVDQNATSATGPLASVKIAQILIQLFFPEGLVTLPANAGRRRTAATNVMVRRMTHAQCSPYVDLRMCSFWRKLIPISRRWPYCKGLQAGGRNLLQLQRGGNKTFYMQWFWKIQIKEVLLDKFSNVSNILTLTIID